MALRPAGSPDGVRGTTSERDGKLQRVARNAMLRTTKRAHTATVVCQRVRALSPKCRHQVRRCRSRGPRGRHERRRLTMRCLCYKSQQKRSHTTRSCPVPMLYGRLSPRSPKRIRRVSSRLPRAASQPCAPSRKCDSRPCDASSFASPPYPIAYRDEHRAVLIDDVDG